MFKAVVSMGLLLGFMTACAPASSVDIVLNSEERFMVQDRQKEAIWGQWRLRSIQRHLSVQQAGYPVRGPVVQVAVSLHLDLQPDQISLSAPCLNQVADAVVEDGLIQLAHPLQPIVSGCVLDPAEIATIGALNAMQASRLHDGTLEITGKNGFVLTFEAD